MASRLPRWRGCLFESRERAVAAVIGVFTLNLETWAWDRCHVYGHVPRGLALFGCAWEYREDKSVGDSLYIFGGHEFIVPHAASCVSTL